MQGVVADRTASMRGLQAALHDLGLDTNTNRGLG
jgi:hypothetical protein